MSQSADERPEGEVLISSPGRLELPRVLIGDSVGLVSLVVVSHSALPIEVSLL